MICFSPKKGFYMKSFFSSPWVVILSLLVAVFGGIPGFIKICELLSSGPQMQIVLRNSIIGELQSKDGTEGPFAQIFLSLSIVNDKNKPLNPNIFDLQVWQKGKWISFERMLIPENIQFPSLSQEIIITEDITERDLQRFSGSISLGMPTTGFLMFRSKECSYKDLQSSNNLPIKIICTDIFGKKYQQKITIINEPFSESGEFPQEGIIVKPIQK